MQTSEISYDNMSRDASDTGYRRTKCHWQYSQKKRTKIADKAGFETSKPKNSLQRFFG